MTPSQYTFPYVAKALLVRQELADVYVAALPAGLLLDVCFSDRLTAEHTDDPVKPYVLGGIQREYQERRLQDIGNYIDRDDVAFPNSIILAANARPNDDLSEDEPADQAEEDADAAADGDLGDADAVAVERAPAGVDRRWRVELGEDGCYELTIPTSDKLAAIVDGQHRLFGFARAKVVDRLSMDMICAIYLDLPKPFQAQVFATINSNQKRVVETFKLGSLILWGFPLVLETWGPYTTACHLRSGSTLPLSASLHPANSRRMSAVGRCAQSHPERLPVQDPVRVGQPLPRLVVAVPPHRAVRAWSPRMAKLSPRAIRRLPPSALDPEA